MKMENNKKCDPISFVVSRWIFISLGALFLMSCSRTVHSVKNADEMSVDGSKGYVGFNFQDPTSVRCYARFHNLSTNKSYRISLEKPEQGAIAAYVLGKQVYEKKQGDPVTIPFSVIPLEPGEYRIHTGEGVTRQGSQHRIKSGRETFQVVEGQVTYLGDFEARYFRLLYLFPVALNVKSIPTDTAFVDSVLSGIPHRYSRVTLK